MEMDYVVEFEQDDSATRVLAAGSPCASGAVEAAERETTESAIPIHPRSTRNPRVTSWSTYWRPNWRKLITRSSLESREGRVGVRPR
jgi:hypothetical protein